jgi:hypothetical protein
MKRLAVCLRMLCSQAQLREQTARARSKIVQHTAAQSSWRQNRALIEMLADSDDRLWYPPQAIQTALEQAEVLSQERAIT